MCSMERPRTMYVQARRMCVPVSVSKVKLLNYAFFKI